MAGTTSSLYRELLLLQYATSNFWKQLERKSTIHGLQTTLLVSVFSVYWILGFGLGSSTELQSNRVPCTLKTRCLDLSCLNGDFGDPKMSSDLTFVDAFIDASTFVPRASTFGGEAPRSFLPCRGKGAAAMARGRVSVGTRILIIFALDPKIIPKFGNLRFGNSKIRETG
jgi:hypothetical protein